MLHPTAESSTPNSKVRIYFLKNTNQKEWNFQLQIYTYIHIYFMPHLQVFSQNKKINNFFFFFFCKTIFALDGGGLRFDSFAIGCAQRAASYGCHLELLLGSAAWFQLPGKGLIRGGLGSFGLGRDPDSSPPSWDEFLLPNDLPTSQVQGILV